MFGFSAGVIFFLLGSKHYSEKFDSNKSLVASPLGEGHAQKIDPLKNARDIAHIRSESIVYKLRMISVYMIIFTRKQDVTTIQLYI